MIVKFACSNTTWMFYTSCSFLPFLCKNIPKASGCTYLVNNLLSVMLVDDSRFNILVSLVSTFPRKRIIVLLVAILWWNSSILNCLINIFWVMVLRFFSFLIYTVYSSWCKIKSFPKQCDISFDLHQKNSNRLQIKYGIKTILFPNFSCWFLLSYFCSF